MRLVIPSALLAASLSAAAPAIAQGHAMPVDDDGEGYYENGYGYQADRGADREAWLTDCRRRLSQRDPGVGGALIGGAVGGIAGNRLAGRGNRTIGTIGGAAVGAAAGLAIDKAEDSARNRDECEAYLDDYYSRYSHPGYRDHRGYETGYYSAPAMQQGYYSGYGYPYPAAGCCGAPMMMVPIVQPKRDCVETVEYVYENVPVRPARRVIPRRKPVPDKRVRITPAKRVPLR